MRTGGLGLLLLVLVGFNWAQGNDVDSLLNNYFNNQNLFQLQRSTELKTTGINDHITGSAFHQGSPVASLHDANMQQIARLNDVADSHANLYHHPADPYALYPALYGYPFHQNGEIPVPYYSDIHYHYPFYGYPVFEDFHHGASPHWPDGHLTAPVPVFFNQPQTRHTHQITQQFTGTITHGKATPPPIATPPPPTYHQESSQSSSSSFFSSNSQQQQQQQQFNDISNSQGNEESNDFMGIPQAQILGLGDGFEMPMLPVPPLGTSEQQPDIAFELFSQKFPVENMISTRPPHQFFLPRFKSDSGAQLNDTGRNEILGQEEKLYSDNSEKHNLTELASLTKESMSEGTVPVSHDRVAKNVFVNQNSNRLLESVGLVPSPEHLHFKVAPNAFITDNAKKGVRHQLPRQWNEPKYSKTEVQNDSKVIFPETKKEGVGNQIPQSRNDVQSWTPHVLTIENVDEKVVK